MPVADCVERIFAVSHVRYDSTAGPARPNSTRCQKKIPAADGDGDDRWPDAREHAADGRPIHHQRRLAADERKRAGIEPFARGRGING